MNHSPSGWPDGFVATGESQVRNWYRKLLRPFGMEWVAKDTIHAKERSSHDILSIPPQRVQVL
jgi:hypothetical protein